MDDIPSLLADQREQLQDQADMTEQEAEERFNTVKQSVMLKAQDANRNWDTDEYNAVTEMLIGISLQQQAAAEIAEDEGDSLAHRLVKWVPRLTALAGLTSLGVATVVGLTTSVGAVLPAMLALDGVVLLLFGALLSL